MTLAPAARIDINKVTNREMRDFEARTHVGFPSIGKILAGETDKPVGDIVTALCWLGLRRSNPGADLEVLWEAALDMTLDDVREMGGEADPPLPPPTSPT